MKTFLHKGILILLLLGQFPVKGFSQRDQQVVNISDPSLKGYLSFANLKGSVKITGYNGSAVIITAVTRYGNEADSRYKSDQLFSVSKKNNNVTLYRSESNRTIDFDLKIPKNFSMKVSSQDNGIIEIISIIGDIEASNASGDVILNSISGSAVISTVNGKITASFLKTGINSPMMFTSLEGSIEVFLPEKTNATLKMRSQNGKLYSDFKIKPSQQGQNAGYRLISDEGWTVGTINNGGPEYMISTYNGNIYLKKTGRSL